MKKITKTTSSKKSPRFKNQQDLREFTRNNPQISATFLAQLRSKTYKEIEKIRKRPLIVFVSQLDAPRGVNRIDMNDIAGITDLANSVSDSSVDILLHSPGGSPEATERIVHILREQFEDISFLVPHSAYSAATMLALSGDEIILHPSAALSPIDPQINGIPAISIKNGFQKVNTILKKEGFDSLIAYLPLLKQYSLHLLDMCDNYEMLSKRLVKEWLNNYMLKDSSFSADKVVKFFSQNSEHLTHSRPINVEKLKRSELLGDNPRKLNVKLAEAPLRELMWESYILFNQFLSDSEFVKLYESQKVSLGLGEAVRSNSENPL